MTSPASGLVTHENPILGYRISLPATYRRSGSTVVTGQEFLGRDSYTVLTKDEELAECLRDGGDIPHLNLVDAYVHVEAHRNVRGISAAEWARASPRSTHHTVEPATIDGREAARLVQQGMTTSYVMSANDRMYVLALGTWPSQHRIADLAATFRAIAPQPFPTPTPPPSQTPRDAARELGQRLAQAFAVRDTDAIARLITAACWIGVWSVVEPVQQGSESCCVLNRSVAPFIQALRDRFASGDFTVTVDPEVQVHVEGEGVSRSERFFVRSNWRESGRTTRIDLFLGEIEGTWRWVGARHHYQRADIGNCVPYRSPWVPATSTC